MKSNEEKRVSSMVCPLGHRQKRRRIPIKSERPWAITPKEFFTGDKLSRLQICNTCGVLFDPTYSGSTKTKK